MFSFGHCQHFFCSYFVRGNKTWRPFAYDSHTRCLLPRGEPDVPWSWDAQVSATILQQITCADTSYVCTERDLLRCWESIPKIERPLARAVLRQALASAGPALPRAAPGRLRFLQEQLGWTPLRTPPMYACELPEELNYLVWLARRDPGSHHLDPGYRPSLEWLQHDAFLSWAELMGQANLSLDRRASETHPTFLALAPSRGRHAVHALADAGARQALWVNKRHHVCLTKCSAARGRLYDQILQLRALPVDLWKIVLDYSDTVGAFVVQLSSGHRRKWVRAGGR